MGKRMIYYLEASYKFNKPQPVYRFIQSRDIDIPMTETWWGVEYDYTEYIEYVIMNGISTAYSIKAVVVKDEIDITGLHGVFYSYNRNNIEDIMNHLLREQEKFINSLSDAEFRCAFYKYGTDYTKQSKGIK